MTPFYPGKEAFADSASANGNWAVVFEDDGDTGYFYALDLNEEKKGENSIQEALQIYNAKSVTDSHKESIASIIWSLDGDKACLLINDYPHAIIDFAAKRAYCRTNFPSPGKWKDHDFTWDDRVLSFFK